MTIPPVLLAVPLESLGEEAGEDIKLVTTLFKVFVNGNVTELWVSVAVPVIDPAVGPVVVGVRPKILFKPFSRPSDEDAVVLSVVVFWLPTCLLISRGK